jgi:PAS domain S-box-containing protein
MGRLFSRGGGPTFQYTANLVDGGKMKGKQVHQNEETGQHLSQHCVHIVEEIPAIFWMTSIDWTAIHYVSPGFEGIWGISLPMLISDPISWMGHILFIDYDRVLAAVRKSIQGKRTVVEYRIKRPDGSIRWILDRGFPIHDFQGRLCHTVRLSEDITDRKKAEGQLHASLCEKEILLQETHHRFKNHLQIVSSLLNLQAGRVSDEMALHSFRATQNCIHEKLSQAEGKDAFLNFAEYVSDLMAGLQFAWGEADSPRVKLKLDLVPVWLTVHSAIPLGLLVNELVSNCYKHAFPGGREGEIQVDLKLDGGKRCLVRIRDNGVGFPNNLDLRTTSSLGLKLVRRLVKQLEGVMEIQSQQGTQVSITIPAGEGNGHG